MLHVYAVYEIHKVWTTLGQSIVKNRSVEKTSIKAFSESLINVANLLLQEYMVWPL